MASSPSNKFTLRCLLLISVVMTHLNLVLGHPCDNAKYFGGYVKDPTDPQCKRYFRCLNPPIQMSCVSSLIFDENTDTCNWSYLVDCHYTNNVQQVATEKETTTATPTRTTATPTTTTTMSPKPTEAATENNEADPAAAAVNPCSVPGASTYNSDPMDCGGYIVCIGTIPFKNKCNNGLYWNPQRSACDWPANVNCKQGGRESPATATKPAPPPVDSGSQVQAGSGDPGACSRLVCYYANWAKYRPTAVRFGPEQVDPFLCTHIIYAFAGMANNEKLSLNYDADIPRLMNLRNKNPSLKILLAIGGWNLRSEPFDIMSRTQTTRQVFIDSAITVMRQHGFDGLDYDWEYPTNKDIFTLLVQETEAAFQKEAKDTGNQRLLLTAAVAASREKIDEGYDVPALGLVLDFALVMTYDLRGTWENASLTGHHSTLFAGDLDPLDKKEYNVDWVIDFWKDQGMPKSKIVVGIPFYGRTFTLSSSSSTGISSPHVGKGSAGTYTRESGFLSYYEICEKGGLPGTRINRPAEMKVPYMVYEGNQWVGYDDPESVQEKASYVVKNGYGGAMIWSIDMDDFAGSFCSQGPYPMLRAIRKGCGAEDDV